MPMQLAQITAPSLSPFWRLARKIFFGGVFSLAIQSGKLLQKPHIALLKEDNVRVGFFERDQFQAVLQRLAPAVRPSSSRSPANCRPQSGPRWDPRTRRDADGRTQDQERVRAVQYRERRRPARRGATARFRGRDNFRDNRAK